LDLGLEEAGFVPVCFVEQDPDCLRLIRSRRPGVPIIEDVREVRMGELPDDVEVVAGGFP
jgi:site-specific DNA-cytosine methylase